MDEIATKIISSALTMFDIMERRVTLVENLNKNRQPFPEMDVVYFLTPSTASVNHMLADFENPKKPKYGNVHCIFTESVSILFIFSCMFLILILFQIPAEVVSMIQSHGNFVSRVKTFKELNVDFLVSESNIFQFNITGALSKMYGSLPDPDFPVVLGRKLANVCIALNEHPSIRYQGSSRFVSEIATAVQQTILQYKKSNPNFVCFGEDKRPDRDRERGQLLILDRGYDCLTPLMHEYTYQAMVNDLLPIEEGVLTYSTQTNKGSSVEKQALLSENDGLWVELRHSHIAKVIETIKERMNDIIQNNASAALAKRSGNSDVSITAMAAAVKELPEYQQTMSKLGQHVAIAQQCMDAFSRLNLMEISQIEQTLSTGFDEEGKEVKANKMLPVVLDLLRGTSEGNVSLDNDAKIRLLAIYLASQQGKASNEDRRQLIQASGLSGADQQFFLNLDKLMALSMPPTLLAGKDDSNAAKGGVFSSMFRRTAAHAPTPEGEYAETRHVATLKVVVESLLNGDLSTDRFPAMGPAAPRGDKAHAKSVRRAGNNPNRWANGKEGGVGGAGNLQTTFEGGRCLVFVAGGLSYAEMKVGWDISMAQKKEVILGSTHLLSPPHFLNQVTHLDAALTSSSLPRPTSL